MMHIRLLSSLGVLALCIIACGDDETESTAAGGSTTTATTASTGGSTSVTGVGGGGGSAGGNGGGTAVGGASVGGGGGSPSGGFPPPEMGTWTGTDTPVMTPSPGFPAPLDQNLAATHFGALPCGPFAENLFDIIVPDGAGPHPLVLNIHGGGFTQGSRNDTYGSATQSYVENGFAWATIDYRFTAALGEGVRTSLQDSQVCLQYIRHHAATLGIDPTRVVLTGGSAGAGTSLWLAMHDDLADPNSSHVILRESTRVNGIIIAFTQATYDVYRWPQDVFDPEYGTQVQAFFDGGGIDSTILDFYGAPSINAVKTDPKFIAYRQEVDMLAHLSSDDPPILAFNTNSSDAPTGVNSLNHHPFHERAVRQAALAVSVPFDAGIPALNLSASQSQTGFALAVTSSP